MDIGQVASPLKAKYDFNFPAVAGFLLLWLLLFAFLDARLVGILAIASLLLTCYGLQADFRDRPLWRLPFWTAASLYTAGTALASWSYWEFYSLYHMRLAQVIGKSGIETFMLQYHIAFPLPDSVGSYGMLMIWIAGAIALAALVIVLRRRGARSTLTIAHSWLRSPVGRPTWWACRGLTLFLGALIVEVSYALAGAIAGRVGDMVDCAGDNDDAGGVFGVPKNKPHWIKVNSDVKSTVLYGDKDDLW